jgi:hypothetical protein
MDGSPGRCVPNNEIGDGDCNGFGASPGMINECDATAPLANLNDPCALHGDDICTCVEETGCGYCGESGTGQCISGTLSGPDISSCPEGAGDWTFEPASILPECDIDDGEDEQVIPSDSIAYDFNTRFKDLFIDTDTLEITMTVDTAVHWDSSDVWSIMLRLGEGGYPSSSDIPVNSTSVGSYVDPPSLLPSYDAWKQYFEDTVNIYHDFSGLNSTQDAFQSLNPGGIVTNVTYIYDVETDRDVIRWFVSFNLAYVTSHYDETNGCICTRYAILQRMECVIPLSAVYRNSEGVSTWTYTRMKFVIFDSGQVTGVISSSITHGFGAFLNSVLTTGSGCTGTDVRLNVTYRLEYDDVELDATMGPMSTSDITFLANCYSLQVLAVTTPVCFNGACLSYVTIQTECRTPTSDGMVFQQCEEEEHTPGLMSINVHAKQCTEDDGCIPVSALGISDHVHAILLYSVYADEVVSIYYDLFMEVLSSPNATLSDALTTTPAPFASNDDEGSSASVTLTGAWFVPCLFMDSAQTREIYDLFIDISNVTVWGLDRVTLEVNDGPYNWTDIEHTLTHLPKSEGGLPVSCEGVPGCDCFSISSSLLLQHMPSSTVFRIRAFASFTPVGVDPIAGRRLLSSSHSHHHSNGGFRSVVIYYNTPSSHSWLSWWVFLLIVLPILFLLFVAPFPVAYYAKKQKGYKPVSVVTPA